MSVRATDRDLLRGRRGRPVPGRAALAALALLVAGCAATGPERPGTPAADTGTLERRLEADAAYRAGEWQRARTAYRAVLAARPDDHEARLRLGNIALHEGRTGDAMRHYRAILAADPRHRRARYNLAMLHLAEAERALQLYLASARAPEAADAGGADEDAVVELLAALRRFAARTQRPPGRHAPADPLEALAGALAVPPPGAGPDSVADPAGAGP